MEQDFWHRRWRKNEIGFHQESINPYLEQHWPTLDIPRDGRVFVPLCGKSDDMTWLHRQGHTVIGSELSAIAVSDFFSERGIAATRTTHERFEAWNADGYRLLCGDFFALEAGDLGPLAAVYDRASLIALPPQMRARYAAHLRTLLPAGLPLLLITVEYPQEEMNGPPFAVEEAEVMALYAPDWQPHLLERADILSVAKRFRDRGVTRMHETVYLLTTPGAVRPMTEKDPT